jgi:methionyl-tRNA formyltransferase
MQMDAGLDTGPVLSRRSLPIADQDDAGSLHDKLAALGADAIVQTLASIEAGKAHALPQPAEGMTYARKIDRDDAMLDWSQPASALERAVRAPDLAAKLKPLGILADYQPPEKLIAEMKDEQERVRRIGRQAGLLK